MQVRVDTVRAGPGPDRASILTGRRRAGPDRTDQLAGLDFWDRTACAQARAGPRGPAVVTTVEGRAWTGACWMDQEEGQGTPWSRSAMMHTGCRLGHDFVFCFCGILSIYSSSIMAAQYIQIHRPPSGDYKH